MTRMLFCVILLSAIPGLGWAEEPKADPTRGPGTERDEDCLVCHAGVGEEEAPKLDLKTYEASSHRKEGCVGCHEDVLRPDLNHEEEDQDLEAVDCARCHEADGEAFGRSVHAEALDDPEVEDKPTCAACHGSHDVRSAEDPESRVHPLGQGATCGQCHDKGRVSAGHPSRSDPAPENGEYAAEAELWRYRGPDGRWVSASCSDCHVGHDIQAAEHTASSVHGARALDTCGRCHEEEAEAFRSSRHFEATQEDGFSWGLEVEDSAEGRLPPACVTCHRMHRAAPPGTERFRAELIHECGTCHEALMKTYVESYHGKATLLGSDAVAKCSDCHGSHGITGVDDPASPIAPENKLETCRSCHEGAPPGFAGFWAHPDHHDPENFAVLYWVYTFMTTLLVSVFSFFGLHTLLWGIREGVDAIRHMGEPRHIYQGPRVSRFSKLDRTLHLLVVISFLGLAATGTPLKFAEASWAPHVFSLMGGVTGAGFLHRVFAVITFVYFFGHIAQLVYKLGPRVRDGTLFKVLIGPDSLVPHPRDLVDVVRNFAWFLGLGKKPTWERWTYWEKFDYWAVFWGVGIIGSSGLVLWFPTLFTHLIPGWLINVALVVHSDEALLAIGFIFGVHFFNSHLRRSKFPMDEVIFTGSVPLEEYREERGREWERAIAEGKVEGRFVPDPHPVFRTWARVFGILAWLTGLIILGLIIHGFITTH